MEDCGEGLICVDHVEDHVRVLYFEFRVSNSGFRVPGFGFRISGFGFMVWGLWRTVERG